YLRELLTAPASRAILAQSCFAVTASLGSLAALVALAMQILAAGLRWQDLLPEGHSWAMGSFAGKLAWLHTWHPLGQALFALLLLNLAALFALAVRKAGGGRSIDQGDEAAY
ncbi:MAG: hypothetical protein FWH49_07240, partial [Clostridiales bacterium]|nr:hypothetical protein [Clostridiales bacterium]